MRRYPLAAGAAVLLVLVAACGSSESAAPTSGGGMEIIGFKYTGSLTYKPGQKVTVTNEDATQHTVTDQQAGRFSTGTIEGNGTGTFTAPATPGSYPFGCRFHPTMTGTLTVG